MVTKAKTAAQLKHAVMAGEVVEIIDPKLANAVRVVKAATLPALTAAIAAGGLAVTNFWNPVGWAAGTMGIAAEGALVASAAFLIVCVGLAVLWAIFFGYEVILEGKTAAGSAKVILKPKEKVKDPA